MPGNSTQDLILESIGPPLQPPPKERGRIHTKILLVT